MPAAKDYSGQKFGRLNVLAFLERRRVGTQSKRFYLCLCDCGREVVVASGAFTSGNTRSCGCLLSDTITKHGQSSTALYAVWHAMLTRCRKATDVAYPLYGGRGISVCERWRGSFEAFAKDMGERPNGATLDRIDVNGNYEPSNCRWATPKQQARNRRHHRQVTWRGKTQPMAAWAEEVGISKRCLEHRLNAGWAIDDALTKMPDRSANQHTLRAVL